MYRRAERSLDLRNQLPFKHALANADDWLCRVADMLRDWEYELCRNRHRLN